MKRDLNHGQQVATLNSEQVLILHSRRNTSTAMARIQVPKKGTFTCDSSTAEEAVQYSASVTWLSQADPMCRGHDWTLIGFRVRFLVNSNLFISFHIFQ